MICVTHFKDIISQGSDDIGKTLLVEMDIDTRDSPPITSKPYTLPLKHFDWVQKEITMHWNVLASLQKASHHVGITCSNSPKEVSPQRTTTKEDVC